MSNLNWNALSELSTPSEELTLSYRMQLKLDLSNSSYNETSDFFRNHGCLGKFKFELEPT